MLLGLVGGCVGVDQTGPCSARGVCAPWGVGEDEEESEGVEGEDPDDPGEGDGDGGDDADPGIPGADGLPCAVRDALAANCGMCHGASPSFGAPMPLTSYDDVVVPAPTDPTRRVYEMMMERMTAEAGMMPPDGNISEEDSAVILDWIAEGAPQDTDAMCGESEPDEPNPNVGPENLPCDAEYVMTAHADGNDEPFVVPTQGADNLYRCFVYASPFAAGEQATAWAPIIDDERVVHHWILYRASSGNYTHGSAVPCDVSLQLTADFVAGWAPGGENVILPDDVGLDLGQPGDFYVLQVHYNNTAHHPDAWDKSGVAFCSTPTARPKTAGILTLGTTGINIPPGAVAHEELGTCGFLSTIFWPPMHILSTSPHMHQLGRGFRTVLERTDGSSEVVTDIPVFDFESQGMYPNDPEIVVNPGDTLRSTCIYDNPGSASVGFGEGTSDEMCFNFVLAYPIDALANRNCGILF
ncbi:MAG: hypothetical protein K0V04_44880 [Deltaproteobacteria bacterium]|nr:hypothetical protein [Deltaproteobacteria bacterium]